MTLIEDLEKRLASLSGAVRLCISDNRITDLATIKRAWFYAKTGRDEPVGSLDWNYLDIEVSAPPYRATQASAKPAESAIVVDEALVWRLGHEIFVRLDSVAAFNPPLLHAALIAALTPEVEGGGHG